MRSEEGLAAARILDATAPVGLRARAPVRPYAGTTVRLYAGEGWGGVVAAGGAACEIPARAPLAQLAEQLTLNQ